MHLLQTLHRVTCSHWIQHTPKYHTLKTYNWTKIFKTQCSDKVNYQFYIPLPKLLNLLTKWKKCNIMIHLKQTYQHRNHILYLLTEHKTCMIVHKSSIENTILSTVFQRTHACFCHDAFSKESHGMFCIWAVNTNPAKWSRLSAHLPLFTSQPPAQLLSWHSNMDSHASANTPWGYKMFSIGVWFKWIILYMAMWKVVTHSSTAGWGTMLWTGRL
jgi:hypothetical protein